MIIPTNLWTDLASLSLPSSLVVFMSPTFKSSRVWSYTKYVFLSADLHVDVGSFTIVCAILWSIHYMCLLLHLNPYIQCTCMYVFSVIDPALKVLMYHTFYGTGTGLLQSGFAINAKNLATFHVCPMNSVSRVLSNL